MKQSMNLDTDYVAKLARIELTDKEKKKFSKDLANILDHFKELQGVDTDNVEPMTGGTDLRNVFREEVPEDFKSNSELTKVFPEEEDGFLRVPKILRDK